MQKKNSSRQNKVAAEIKKSLSEFLLCNSIYDIIKSSSISITDVVMSPCLQHAKVYIIPLSGDVSQKDCIDFMERHSHTFRKHVSNCIRLKFAPDFKFFIDDSFDYAQKIENLLAKIPVYAEVKSD